MKKIAIIFSVIALVFAMRAPASAVFIDFESFADDAVVSGPGVFSDVEFSAGTTTIFVDPFSVGIPGPDFGGEQMAGTDPFVKDDPFRADFLIGGVSSVSVVIGDFDDDADDLFLRAFSNSDVLLDEATFALASDVFGGPSLSVSAANIAYVLFGSTGTFANSVYFDNFEFVAAVPEPSSLLLLGSGLLGLGLWGRKRRFTRRP